MYSFMILFDGSGNKELRLIEMEVGASRQHHSRISREIHANAITVQRRIHQLIYHSPSRPIPSFLLGHIYFKKFVRPTYRS